MGYQNRFIVLDLSFLSPQLAGTELQKVPNLAMAPVGVVNLVRLETIKNLNLEMNYLFPRQIDDDLALYYVDFFKFQILFDSQQTCYRHRFSLSCYPKKISSHLQIMKSFGFL